MLQAEMGQSSANGHKAQSTQLPGVRKMVHQEQAQGAHSEWEYSTMEWLGTAQNSKLNVKIIT